ncbi:MAG: ATP-binding protein [Flavobacteriales bacterium]|nr:ATP-binding protein [Flavobacteriales bacterium]
MDVRLVQVGFMFNKFHRIVRDAASIEKKKVNLTLTGTEIEIDRNVLKIMSDSLVHLVRNAVSHGIETPKDRKAMQKGVEGQVILTASNEKDMVIIKVQDDGAGMDPSLLKKKAIEKGIISKEMAEQMSKEDAYQLIFEPGFSNAREITALSGRGVGMDVVKRATESIGGKIDIKSELGKGSEITLSLPASMAVKGALLFELGSQEFAVPLSYTEAVISLDKSDIQKFNGGLISQYLDQTLSLVFLDDLFDCDDSKKMISKLHRSYDRLSSDTKLEVLLLSFGDKLLGIVVDKLLQQKEIIEKPLFKPLDQIELFSGATILGNGNVCLVLDAAYIMRYLFGQNYK